MSQSGKVQVRRAGHWEDLMPFVGENPLKAAHEIRAATGLPARVLNNEGERMRHQAKEAD